ncbi:MAG: hypothetical protein LBF64_05765, partial [Oscillospiraceae bacterium]|nr:hypothetical protein [Oscillospiraceae bacterium]
MSRLKRSSAMFLVMATLVSVCLTGPVSTIGALASDTSLTGSADDYNGSDMWLRYVPVEDPALLQSYKNTVKSIVVPEDNAAELFRFSDTDIFEESYGYKGLRQPAGSTEIIPKTTLGAARIELERALRGLLGETIPVQPALADGAL